ncbi:recombinase family protein [Blautia caecimuris]|uniref:recombinase family protein n=1 Tax=Blautia caecimuris TaxID=1796615 RepID=UPI0034B5900B
MAENGITWGYARISSVTQHEDRQIKKLKEFGLEERNIIVDKESGKNLERDGYQLLKTKLLRAGDTLVIKELDRLGRKKSDIKRELEEFKEAGVRVKILDIPTTLTEFKEETKWIQEMITNILIEVLGGFAEEERRKILKRQREGIDVALEKGVKFGRPQVQVPEDWERVIALVENKEITSVEAMSLLNLKKTTYYKLRKMMS